MPLLEVRDLKKWYGKRRKVVNGVSFDVNQGEVVGLLGPNGAGKTTSFRMTMGLIDADGGQVLFDGKDVTKLPMYKRAQSRHGLPRAGLQRLQAAVRRRQPDGDPRDPSRDEPQGSEGPPGRASRPVRPHSTSARPRPTGSPAASVVGSRSPARSSPSPS